MPTPNIFGVFPTKPSLLHREKTIVIWGENLNDTLEVEVNTKANNDPKQAMNLDIDFACDGHVIVVKLSDFSPRTKKHANAKKGRTNRTSSIDEIEVTVTNNTGKDTYKKP